MRNIFRLLQRILSCYARIKRPAIRVLTILTFGGNANNIFPRFWSYSRLMISLSRAVVMRNWTACSILSTVLFTSSNLNINDNLQLLLSTRDNWFRYQNFLNNQPYLKNERQNVSPINNMFSPHLNSSRGSSGSGGLIGLLDDPVLIIFSSFEVFSENIADLSLTSSGFGDLLPDSRIFTSVFIWNSKSSNINPKKLSLYTY